MTFRGDRLPFLLVAGLLCASCSSGAAMTSTQLTGQVRSPIHGGFTYYLPKRVLEVAVWENNWRKGEEIARTRVFATFGRDLALQPVRTIPDRNYLMRLVLNPSATSHDHVSVQMDPDGLLKLVDTKLTDELPQIVAELGQLAKLGAGIPPDAKGRTWQPEDVVAEIRLVASFWVDPTDPTTYEPKLAAYGITLRASPMVADACCELRPNAPCEPVRGQSGVCYRPVVPYRVVLNPGGILVQGEGSRDADEGRELEGGIEEIFMLPNRSPVVCLPINRAPFVQSEFRVEFDRGLLTSMTSTKPSEVLGFLKIPIEVAKTIVSIPAELLSFRVTHYENTSRAAAAEREALEAINELSKAQQEAGR